MSKPKDFISNGKFKCTSCGACCSFMSPVADKGQFPKEWINDKGACIHLQKDSQIYKCAIYETRPDICKIEKTLKPHSSDKQIAKLCSIMKNEFLKRTE